MIRGVQAGAEGVVLEGHAGATAQSLLRVTSVFPMVKWGFVCFSTRLGMQGIGTHKKSSLAAVWLELHVFVHCLE